ncbi:1-acyl-sn-glycerol-3-phosphate acyltransferase [Allochromatium palmeri]|uniref:1-acyl-sn-glycerol-3-phosphate acyltransferase n=1 Tax=Allochromatium palmeri TaxID=231048 RepID=A0A6N8ECV1_9GAMM|nr:1-acyl-sn-glycerol-3-phosphate acyltransferase [Allochromatium palmeri]
MRRWSADRLFDLSVTFICWLYFTLGFLFLFAPLYLWSSLFHKEKARAFQRYNRLFYRFFFRILHNIAPRQHWEIDAAIGSLRGSVILCNHRSYLDPLLLIAHLYRATTIVKSVFFTVPIFGWVIRTSGYLPATASGPFAALMLTQMESLPAYLASGGNLFVFPEGTRSRDSRIAPLHQGALKIARQCRVPVHVLVVENTDRLFTPGVFLFAASQENTIRLRLVETIAVQDLQCSLSDLGQRVRRAMEGRQREAELA